MTGPKTNEGATKVGERVGTRAQVRYVRSSASKAREVLDLIRGRHVRDADAILQFTERDIAIVIRKALASAVANAQHNDSQDPDELYIAACFADEGPTLKRFRPRARGRATRVRKRTCHITVIVARMSDSSLEQLRRKEERQPAAGRRGRIGGRTGTSRRERVARSRQQAAGVQVHDHDHDHDHEHDDAVVDEVALDSVEAEEDLNEGEPTEQMVEEAEELDGIEPAADEADEADEADGAPDTEPETATDDDTKGDG